MLENIRPYCQEQDATPLDFPLRRKIQSIIFIIVSLIYAVFMFIPVFYERVYDAGIVFKNNMLMLALVSLSDMSDRLRYAPYILLASALVCVVLVVIFILSSIKSYGKCRNGDTSLVINNILLLVSIPVTFLFPLDIAATYFDSSMSSIDQRVGVWLAAIGFIALILVFIFGKVERVSILSALAIILAIVCFASMFLFVYNPVMTASYDGANGEVANINVDLKDFEVFYNTQRISNHKNGIIRNGMVKVFNGGSFVTRLMIFLPSYIPTVMFIAAHAMAISAFIIIVSLIKKSFSDKKRSLALIISKIALSISTLTFAFAFVEISIAINEMKEWINMVLATPVAVDNSYATMTVAPTQYTLLAISAAVLLLILNVKGHSSPKEA